MVLARNPTALAEVAAAVVARRGRCGAVSADVGDRGELALAAERCVALFGEPDILVNAAGVNLRPTLGSLTTFSST